MDLKFNKNDKVTIIKTGAKGKVLDSVFNSFLRREQVLVKMDGSSDDAVNCWFPVEALKSNKK